MCSLLISISQLRPWLINAQSVLLKESVEQSEPQALWGILPFSQHGKENSLQVCLVSIRQIVVPVQMAASSSSPALSVIGWMGSTQCLVSPTPVLWSWAHSLKVGLPKEPVPAFIPRGLDLFNCSVQQQGKWKWKWEVGRMCKDKGAIW